MIPPFPNAAHAHPSAAHDRPSAAHALPSAASPFLWADCVRAAVHMCADEREGDDVAVLRRELQAHVEVLLELLAEEATEGSQSFRMKISSFSIFPNQTSHDRITFHPMMSYPLPLPTHQKMDRSAVSLIISSRPSTMRVWKVSWFIIAASSRLLAAAPAA